MQVPCSSPIKLLFALPFELELLLLGGADARLVGDLGLTERHEESVIFRLSNGGELLVVLT